jgi:DNA-binding NtrC family response regulator
MQETMTHIVLIGGELALLEGLAQTFASLGFTPVVAQSIAEGRELAAQHPPLVVIVSRALASAASGDTLSIPMAPGGAMLLYRSIGSPLVTFSHSVQRAVLADLALPLERNRLVALVQHIEQRARVTGRSGGQGSSREITPA